MTVRRFPNPPPPDSLISAAIGRLHVLSAFVAQADGWDYTFNPDLTPTETAALDDAVLAAKSHVGISYAEYQAIKDDLAGLRTYAGIATPTLAQTAAAVKAQSRIIRALLRD